MRLLECLDTIHPSNGGGVEGTKRRCAALKALGHQVEMLSLDDPNAPWIDSWPVKVHALGPGSTGYGYTPRLIPWLQSNSAQFDALIVNGLWRYHSVGVWRGVRRSSVPYFVIPHSMLNPWFAKAFPIKHLKKTLIWRTVQWKVLRDATAVFFTCEQERDLARRSFTPYVCKEDVVSLAGTDVPKLEKTESRQLVLRAHPELAGKRIILFVSRLHPMKGCDVLIQAFADVCQEENNLHLLIAGPGDDTFARTLRRLATDRDLDSRITWAGEVTDEMKWAALNMCDVFALPSHCEATPLAVVEALGCGVPAIISDQVNIWKELVASGAAIVGSDDARGTTLSLRTWLRLSGSEAAKMRENARNCFLKYFDSRSNTGLFLDGLRRHGVG